MFDDDDKVYVMTLFDAVVKYLQDRDLYRGETKKLYQAASLHVVRLLKTETGLKDLAARTVTYWNAAR